ncbi:MAG: phytanoyl-CoA dioxygenase family protein [Pseudomonadota bacterium]
MASRTLTDNEIDAFERDGVVLVREAADMLWIDRLNDVVKTQLAEPSRWVNDANPGAERDRFFTDRYLWRDNAAINAFVFEGGMGALAAQATRSVTMRFYFDHLLVKEPGTATPTPWHQDIPYWPFMGHQICSVWLALTDCDARSSGLEFIRGSHADRTIFKPEVFGARDNHPSAWQADGGGKPVPDIEANRDAYDIVSYDTHAGDALVFSAWTLHGAPGNSSPDHRRAAISTRWLGDDAVWFPHDGTDPTVSEDDVNLESGDPAHDDTVFPVVWAN